MVEAVQSKEVSGLSTVYGCLLQSNLCPLGLVDQETNEIMRVYGATGGIKNIRTPAEFFGLPAVWVQAVDVIESEIAIFRKLKKIEDG